MAERSYQQICGVAQALDLLGERWTLLVLRELMLGPKRFSALREALPGINANLLTARLRKLTEAGVIEQIELPSPAAGVHAYALTERGEELREPLAALALWGYTLLEPEQQFAAGWQARGSWLALTRMADAERRGALADLPPTAINVEVDGESFVLTTDGHGHGTVQHGVDSRPDAALSCDMHRFHLLLEGSGSLDEIAADRASERVARPLISALAS